MAKLAGVLLLVAAAACTTHATRIAGGNPATIDQYPSIVQVEFRTVILWGQSCAANVLTPIHLVSAAHCFDGLLFSLRNRRIRAGTDIRGSGGVVITLSRVVNHPSYGHVGMDGDISMILLDTSLVYSPVIQPVSIPSQGFQVPNGVPVTQAGWGTTSAGGAASTVLRDATINTIDRDLCAARYAGLIIPQIVTENMICAGILDKGGRNACQGDFGGPLYYQNMVVGITSWGYWCANNFYPGVNVRVSSYTNWVVATAADMIELR